MDVVFWDFKQEIYSPEVDNENIVLQNKIKFNDIVTLIQITWASYIGW